MVFISARSIRQRQQVVELMEIEGTAGIRRGNFSSGVSTSEVIVANSNNMNRHKGNRHMRHISLPENFQRSPYRDQISPRTTTVENEIHLHRANINNMSQRSFQSSLHHVSQDQSTMNNVHDTVRSLTRFAKSDFEDVPYVPGKSPARNNSGSSFSEDDDGSLSKQLDSTRRDAVMTLSEKREKKAELVRKESRKSKEKTIGLSKMLKYSISMSFQKFEGAIISIAYTLELWYNSLKLIEGNLGSGVASYFKFLRWLFLLNFVTLIISLSFLVIPQLLARLYVNSNEVPDVAKNGGTYLEKHFFDIPDENGTVPPPLMAAALLRKNNPYQENAKFSVPDLFTGEGFLTATTLYYGFYKNGTLELAEGYPYDLPNAYFFSMAVCYGIILVTVSISMARSYRITFIENRGTLRKVSLALKVFSGWDFSIATPEAAALNKRLLCNEIKETLNEQEFKDRDSSCLSCFTNIIVQASLNILFFFLMGGIAFLMWDLLGRHSAYLANNSINNNTMTMAIITSLIMNFLPIGFSWIIRFEDYRNPRTAVYVTLLRTFLLNVVVIGTISAFWLTRAYTVECWETALGQEVYRLLVTDFIISTLVMGLVETAQSFIQRKFWKGLGQLEFDIARNTLNLIYNQTLFLVGFYFSPLLSAVIVFKLFITFHIKKSGALYNSQAPKKSWRAAQTQTLFLILTFITLLGVFLMFGYIIFEVPPSKCGPFGGFTFMYEAIRSGIFQLEDDNWFWQVMIYLVKPGFIGGILIAMGIATYILQAKAKAHATEADILKNMLMNETKDKAFLFKCIKNAEKHNQRRGSPTLSTNSSFHTPLSERRKLRKASRETHSPFFMRSEKGPKLLANQKRFYSASEISSGSWSYGRGYQRSDKIDQPSTSSGASGTTYEIELQEREH